MAQHSTANRHGLHLFERRHKPRTAGMPSLHDDEGPGLLASPAFWAGGLLSLAAWAGLAAALGIL